jgi:hypothetical protein
MIIVMLLLVLALPPDMLVLGETTYDYFTRLHRLLPEALVPDLSFPNPIIRLPQHPHGYPCPNINFTIINEINKIKVINNKIIVV